MAPDELRLVDERYGDDDDDVDVSELLTPPVLTAASKGLEYVLTKGIATWVLRFAKSKTIEQKNIC